MPGADGVDGRGLQVLLVTSAVPGEGKSTVAANLAAALAETEEGVLLIDADLRRPSQSEVLRIEAGVGLSTVLLGRVAFGDVVQEWGRSGLHVLPSGAVPPNPGEILTSPAMRRLLAEVRERYSYVVLDCPPLLPVADAAILSQLVDGVLVIANVRKLRRPQLEEALTSLSHVGARVLGVALNRVHRDTDAYSYQSAVAPRGADVVGPRNGPAGVARGVPGPHRYRGRPAATAVDRRRQTGNGSVKGASLGSVASPDVLVLCTANQCRSPAAAAVLAARLRGTGITVASAGFAARVGAPADERTRALVPEVPDGFRAQQLTPALLTATRLVLTMTRDQRTAAVSLVPVSVRRTFTLTEFADLVGLVSESGELPAEPGQRLDELVSRAPRLRGSRAARMDRPDEVVDPYLLDHRGYRDVMAQVVDAASAVADHVLGGDLGRARAGRGVSRPAIAVTRPTSGR